MEQNDKDLEEKKSLLQAEILDKNYDQMKFVQFCLSKKPNGDDLTIWTLDELKSTVQEFTSQFQNTNINTNLNINNEKYEQIRNKIFNLELDNTNLKDQNNKLIAINKDLVSKLQNENKNYEKVVDKTMISSMLIKYFNPSTPSSIKKSLLETIANFLEYTDEEREQIGLPSKSGNNNVNSNSSGNNLSDQLSKIGNNLYNFITNS